MKPRIFAFVFLFTLSIIIPLTAQAASSNISPTANILWTIQSLTSDAGTITNLSTGFVGDNQVPLIIYTKSGVDRIYEAFHETTFYPGNCGVDNSWFCFENYMWVGINSSTLSELAVYNHYSESPVENMVGYVYETDNKIFAVRDFRGNDMESLASSQFHIIQLDKFGTDIVGALSLQYDINGKERVALTVKDGGIYKLVYMSYTGIDNTTCTDFASPYQCDVIDSSFAAMGEPSLKVSPSGAFTAIAYTKAGSLYYAHPESEIAEANCGPGGNTWRCKYIWNSGADSHVVDGVDLEMYDLIQVAFLEDRTDINQTSLILANYVRNYGNCGEDNDWNCQVIQTLGDDSQDYDFSLQIEEKEMNYAVIAYSYMDTVLKLGLTYPKERIGETSGNCDNTDWVCQEIAGSSGGFILAANGKLASLALDDYGLGLIGYIQTVPLVRTSLMIGFQEQMTQYLPLIKH